jgi:hypothetical protein
MPAVFPIVLVVAALHLSGTVCGQLPYPPYEWVLRYPVQSPPPHDGHALVHAGAWNVTLLFGGAAFSNGTAWAPSAETWGWDGLGWTQLAPVSSPPPRWGHSMAYDTNRQRVVLFGGAPGLPWQTPVSWLSDTWEFDGATWTARSPTSGPPALASPTLAYDSLRGVSILLGISASGVVENWDWDGQSWAQRTSWGSLLPGASYDMAYDPLRGRCVVAIGDACKSLWEWDGSVWSGPVYGPALMGTGSMVWHPPTGRVVRRFSILSGGGGCSTPFPDSGLWGWDGTSWDYFGGFAAPSFVFHAPSGRLVSLAAAAGTYEMVRSRSSMNGLGQMNNPGTAGLDGIAPSSGGWAAGAGLGPHALTVASGTSLLLAWAGPGLMPFLLFAGPLNANNRVSCAGSVDIGTPSLGYSDVHLLFSGLTDPQFQLGPAQNLLYGVAHQVIAVPPALSGLTIGLQGVVVQPPVFGLGKCVGTWAYLTAALAISIT